MPYEEPKLAGDQNGHGPALAYAVVPRTLFMLANVACYVISCWRYVRRTLAQNFERPFNKFHFRLGLLYVIIPHGFFEPARRTLDPTRIVIG
jgi:hypothetical protein